MTKKKYLLSIGVITLLGVIPALFPPVDPSVPTMMANASAEHMREAASNTNTVELLDVVNQDDINLKDRLIAHSTITAQPINCQKYLKYFYVRYDGSVPRAYGSNTTIMLNGKIQSVHEKIALITHEYGHLVDMGCLRGDPTAGRSAFMDGHLPVYLNDPSLGFYAISWSDHETKRPEARKADFISGYAKTNPFEEWAEFYTAVVLQKPMVEERAKNNKAIARKLAWMEQHILQNSNPIATGNGKAYPIPWDITLLPFDWHPEEA